MERAIEITIHGRVQGVGFRPFVFQLAKKYQLYGTVQNNIDGVFITVEGKPQGIDLFLKDLGDNPPRLARIDKILIKETIFKNLTSFRIIPSERAGKLEELIIPVDTAVCKDCLDEMNNPHDFRYRYPFINCTQCGPRYTIIEELPYDRPFTSMKTFPMCDNCEEEYRNPLNRRHHAQPIACPKCGPELQLLTIDGKTIAKNDNALKEVKDLIEKGYIIAIKGLGGYHLACDAKNEHAIARLRIKKNRPNRPLAIMASTVETVRQYCITSLKEEKILQSPESPIVVFQQRELNSLPKNLAPGLRTLGIMLPYTPLHHLLLDEQELPMIVLTSANPSGMPILHKDEEALSYLNGIADFVLTHNRKILHPLDDSVVQIIDDELQFIRRSRGYVPEPLTTKHPVDNMIAYGGQQKNTFAIGRNRQIFIGPHIGDMENEEMVSFYLHELHHFQHWLGIKEKVVTMDKHPHYSTSIIAQSAICPNDRVIRVQHHHAHHVSCMEDNQITEPSFGIVLDGTGYGDDRNIWGFEILYGDANFYKRLAHLTYTPLPGGEMAIQEPWRTAVGMIIGYLGEEGKGLAQEIFPDKKQEIHVLNKMIERKINSPLAGTCGRLFDTVSAILDICQQSTYDGEAAIRLSELIPRNLDITKHYPYTLEDSNGMLEINFSAMLKQIIYDRIGRKPTIEIVEKFHQTIIVAMIDAINKLSARYQAYNRNVTLSGGSFHNPFLLAQLKKRLVDKGFKVFTNKNVPPNDGGLALGQLIIAANKMKGNLL